MRQFETKIKAAIEFQIVVLGLQLYKCRNGENTCYNALWKVWNLNWLKFHEITRPSHSIFRFCLCAICSWKLTCNTLEEEVLRCICKALYICFILLKVDKDIGFQFKPSFILWGQLLKGHPIVKSVPPIKLNRRIETCRIPFMAQTLRG